MFLSAMQRSGDEEPQLQEYRVMVSIAVPAFDRKLNSYVTNEVNRPLVTVNSCSLSLVVLCYIVYGRS
jgi:hypothetical protein